MRAHVHSDGRVCRYVECRGRVAWADGPDDIGGDAVTSIWGQLPDLALEAGCGLLAGFAIAGVISGVLSLAWALGEVVVRLAGWR